MEELCNRWLEAISGMKDAGLMVGTAHTHSPDSYLTLNNSS